jgi:FKBP-type peptidyl-prolyl cis-trans isomerase FklB
MGMDMKFKLVVLLCTVLLSSQANAAEKIELKTERDKLSYQKGVYWGNEFKKRSMDVDQKIFLRGFEDALSGAEPLLTTKEMVAIEEKFQREREAKREQDKKKLAEKNKKEGEAFLAANAKRPGVKTLPSGLQYKVIAEGKGRRPHATDWVIVNYRGSLIDGTVFDDSNKHPEHPAVMPVSGNRNNIPPGWTEALQHMKEGSRWQIFIPSKLGFGEVSFGPYGQNVVMIFDIELISIKKAVGKEKGN